MINHLVDFLTTFFESVMRLSVLLSILLVMLLLSRQWILRRFGASFSYQMWFLVPICFCLMLMPSLPLTLTEPLISIEATSSYVFSSSASASESNFSFFQIMLAIWGIGFAIAVSLVCYSLLKHRAFILRGIQGLSPEEYNLIRSNLTKRAPSRIYKSATVQSPMLIGLFRTKLILPQGFLSQFSALQRQLILAHETHHYGRFDIYWNHLAMLVVVVFWFHPLVWLSYLRFRQDQELSCDQAVLAHKPETDKQQYARALVTTLESACPHFASLSFGKFGDNKIMFERINQLRNNRKTNAFTSVLVLAFSTLFVAFSLQAADLTSSEKLSVNKAPKSDNVVSPKADTATDAKLAPPPPPPPPPAAPKPPKSLKPVKSVSPEYPPQAAKDNVEGFVVMSFAIEPDGKVKNIKVVGSKPEGVFDESATKALSKWRYQKHNKEMTYATIQMDFTLDAE